MGLQLAAPALAHKASDSYLQLDAQAHGLSVRWDVALRDLDVALDLDLNADGKLTWGEVKTGWPRIEAYMLPRLRIAGCALQDDKRGLERRNDGAYAVLYLSAACQLPAAPVITYTLFREVDPTHRGIMKIQRAHGPLTLQILDPMHSVSGPPATAQAGAPSPGPGPAAVSLSSGLGFAKEGMRHILTGYDHILFLVCLLLPAVMRRNPGGWQPVESLSQAVRPMVGIISAFTIAHSITLALAATHVISLSPAFINPAIAATIVLAALDNVWPIFPVRRISVTFVFGLIHGFGFAGTLAELDLPTARFAWALLQFNVGLELGQFFVVVSVLAALFVLRERRLYPALAIHAGSGAAIVVGVLWLIERTANVSLLGL